MNTPILTSDARRNVVLFLNGALDGFRGRQSYGLAADGETQVLEMTDVPVFRSGTFRDSFGIQHTWEPLHIDQMALHFDLLKQRGIFAGVPVRKGHPSFFGPDPIDSVIGWHTGLRTEERVNPVDNQTYTYLLATFSVIDPASALKVQNGLFAHRSAEVGSYIANNEAEFWPVYQGFAYVDIPAVEGLNFSKFASAAPVAAGQTFSIMDSEKEAPVTGAADPNPPAAPTPTPPATPPATNPTPSGPAPVPTPPNVPDPEPAATHSSAQNVQFMFTIGGRQTTDFAAVQAHVTALEDAQREQVKFAREAFVDQLATNNKITAPQIESTKAFALGLTDEQYTQWQATQSLAPAVPLLQTHGRGAVGMVVPTTQTSEADEAYSIAAETVEHLRLGGMPQAQLEQTVVFKRLQQLQSQRPSA